MKTKSVLLPVSLFLTTTLTIVFCLTSCQPPPAPADAMTQEQVKTLMDKAVQMWNTADPKIADEILAADFKRVSPAGNTNNVDEFKQALSQLKEVWSEVQLTINETYVDGDKVISQWTWKATNTGPLGENIPATGKTTSVDGMNILTVKDGKVVEEKAYWDQLGSNLELGFTLTPPQMASAEAKDAGAQKN